MTTVGVKGLNTAVAFNYALMLLFNKPIS